MKSSVDVAQICRLFRKKTEGHHSPYVIMLSDATDRPGVYVGMTGIDPLERFAQHCRGEMAGRGIVQDRGRELLMEATAHLSNCSEPEARRLEFDLAKALRRAGFSVFGGH